jgi:D-sedoheptulose 7-phosphate isomerase
MHRNRRRIAEQTMQQHIAEYSEKLAQALRLGAMKEVSVLGDALRDCWERGGTVYLCGNGGSAANAQHIASDLLYGAGLNGDRGLRVEALCGNPATLTCLANETGYDAVYSGQLRVKANAGDILIVLSGTGNSSNVVNALEIGNAKGMKTFAIVGYSGGACKMLAQHAIHFEVNDMQIAEDLQLIIGHMCTQWLCANPVDRRSPAYSRV